MQVFFKKNLHFSIIICTFAQIFGDMKRIFPITIALLLSVWMLSAERRTVVFDVDIHCQGCITKIEKNIAFERGVKDLVCDLDAKTDIRQLQAAFAKINKPAKVHNDPVEADRPDQAEHPTQPEHANQPEHAESLDAHTGASMQVE